MRVDECQEQHRMLHDSPLLHTLQDHRILFQDIAFLGIDFTARSPAFESVPNLDCHSMLGRSVMVMPSSTLSTG
jgi:hypothetical protein